MSDRTRAVVLQHWDLSNARRWEEFRKLLAPDLLYEAPQTREYIDSGHGYFEMFRTWPGDWKATVKQLVCDGDQAVSVIDFAVGGEVMTGISVFRLRDGLIASVTDYWPDPYEPPPRQTPYLQRRAA